MLALRLQRAQTELQAHRSWLNTFITGRWSFTGEAEARHLRLRTFKSTRYYSDVETQAHTQQATHGKGRTSWTKNKKQRTKSAYHINLQALYIREDLNKAIAEYDAEKVFTLYNSLPTTKPLNQKDVGALSQCVHHCLRKELYRPEATRQRDAIDSLVTFTSQLVSDIRNERLLPSTVAHVHLLGVYKESGTWDAGIEFWRWLEQQGEDYTGPEVYALAIDLLAINGSPLNDLEELYRNALARFPGSFSAYHLSPGAILRDREQELDIKGLPMSLFHSITLARLLRGDSRNAYLALDTAFRLFPTAVASRLLNYFQDERPVSESYTVFALACRAGIQVSNNQFRGLLARLRASSNLESPTAHITALRAMVAVMYLRLASSGALTSNSVGEFTISLTQILRGPEVSHMGRKQRQRIVDAVLALVRKTIELFVRYGALPTTSAFNSIITNVAGYGRSREVLGIVAADMKALKIEENEVTRRSLLTAAGLLTDAGYVLKYWKNIVAARKTEGSNPDIVDLRVFIKAARSAGLDEFAKAELAIYKQYLDFRHIASIEDQLNRPISEIDHGQDDKQLRTEETLEALKGLEADLIWVDERARDGTAVQDLSTIDVPMMLLPLGGSVTMPEAELKSLYDDLSTELRLASTPELQDRDATLWRPAGSQSSSEQDVESPPEPSITMDSNRELEISKISIAQLRYESWKALNYLLWIAEKHDHEYDKVVDHAIAKGVKPPARVMGLTKEELEEMQRFGLSGDDPNQSREKRMSVEKIAHARHEIMRLRGMKP